LVLFAAVKSYFAGGTLREVGRDAADIAVGVKGRRHDLKKRSTGKFGLLSPGTCDGLCTLEFVEREISERECLDSEVVRVVIT
jgi:hypothetical protein